MNKQVWRRILGMAAAAALAGSISAVPAQAAGPDYTFRSSGDSASLSWWDAGGDNGWIYVTRSENREVGMTFAYLNYFVQRAGSIEAGSGQIPGDHFSGRLSSGLSLDTDTSTLGPPYFVRTSGAGGPISIAWERTHSHRSAWSGQQEYSFVTPWGATLTFRLIGSRQTFSATASGTAFGAATGGTNTWAEIGQNRQVQFTYITE